MSSYDLNADLAEIAANAKCGRNCCHCDKPFVDEHGHEVLCDSCFKKDGGDSIEDEVGSSGIPRATHPEI